MLHLDLFSGIGGFAYAADQVWDNVEHVFCDNDPFCQQVLSKHWPEAKIYGDIKEITADTYDGRQAKQEQQAAGNKQRHRKLDLLTGGFPCQPFSAAGLRRGTADERHLWPEMLRVIQLTKPQWVIAENVRGIISWNDGLVFEQVCSDLEAAGYEVQPFIIPALAINAPHRRDRVWFVGHAKHDGQYGAENPEGHTQGSDRDPQRPHQLRQPKRADSLREAITNPRSRGRSRQNVRNQQPRGAEIISPSKGYDWNADWHEVATELCSMDDGLPTELDGFKLSKPQHRKEQLKAYGNAIVPQVAVELLRAIDYATARR